MTRLSTLQYNMLRMFSEEGGNFYLSIVNAQKFDQRPFRSMLIQKWVEYRPGRGFHVTKLGTKAYREFETHDITRKNPTLPLTSYFDLETYGVKPKATAVERKPAAMAQEAMAS